MPVSSRRWELVAVAFAISFSVTAPAARAQGKEPLTEPKTIPTDLASALIASGGVSGPDAPRILVGSAPEWVMPRIFVPAGGRVLGAAFQGTTVLTIVNIALARDSIISDLRKSLIERGWKNVPAMQTNSFGGFRPAPATPSDAPITRVTLCDGAQTLNTSLVRRDDKSADIAYRIATAQGIGVCNPPQLPTSMVRSPWPVLYNPVGSADGRMTGDCSVNMMGPQSTGTTLRTAMPAESILDSYAKQLADSGWKVAGDRAGTIGRTFTRTDADGAPVELTLTVAATARSESCRDVNMAVRTGRKP
jgi:hypothetical protein